MPYLKITIIAKVQLSKSAGGAVAETIRAHDAVQNACRALRQSDMAIYPDEVNVEQYQDDAGPSPAKIKRTRKPRAALGSGPLAQTAEQKATEEEAIAAQYEALRRRAPPPLNMAVPLPPTTGADGEDLLAIPPHLVRS